MHHSGSGIAKCNTCQIACHKKIFQQLPPVFFSMSNNLTESMHDHLHCFLAEHLRVEVRFW